jgi:O-acetyl-ADP-ribose deacetylase (regulator of RNase III)
MIKTVTGDILTATTGYILHGCNAQGKMGIGLALQIREKYPQVYEDYLRAFHRDQLKLGNVIYTTVSKEDEPTLIVASCITQEYYGYSTTIQYVDTDAIIDCFKTVMTEAILNNLPIHFPKIGAGYGNSRWNRIYPRIQDAVPYMVEATLWEQ